MEFFGGMFGGKNDAHKPARTSLQEEALTTIDNLNAQIMMLENNPDLSEEEKAEKIRLLKREIKTFAEGMGWKYDE